MLVQGLGLHHWESATERRDMNFLVARPVHLHQHTSAARARKSANAVSANLTTIITSSSSSSSSSTTTTIIITTIIISMVSVLPRLCHRDIKLENVVYTDEARDQVRKGGRYGWTYVYIYIYIYIYIHMYVLYIYIYIYMVRTRFGRGDNNTTAADNNTNHTDANNNSNDNNNSRVRARRGPEFGRGDDMNGDPHRAHILKFELFHLAY